ncbi:class I SAM-dependent methyltransferase [Sphingobium sufflavum]|uniref:class I SAM-dependent methyltransferase n=1 Tax=Sphingobium sufflavum TaxID=1129547 RepID=UPI001F3ADA49|nr:class I SAM-dependent methyltransferase [Sphingobium sufflavum]MCE7796851.1 class I SAM-dependent methyltransferase [Sphingobium sufflavum]
MTIETPPPASPAPRNWFASGGESYARYRPTYPDELPAFLAGAAPDRALAVDVGCGNGQFTAQLAAHFEAVVGLDSSADQIAHAAPHAGVRYACAPAEALGLADGCASLVTAAQAAHWFDLSRFYAEVRRVAAPGAVVALVSYGVPVFDGEIAARFGQFYWEEIGGYWPPERRLVESGYAGIEFPFAELAWPAMTIRRAWDLAAFMGYVSTWSALRRVEEAGQGVVVSRFGEDMARLWGDAARLRPVEWPITMRLGRV